MARIMGRGSFVSGVVAVFLLVVAGAALATTVSALSVAAVAQTGCLPAPNLLFSEVAQVAGVDSQLWADLQAVEQADAADGAKSSGQVVQDMLAVVEHDGYRWDCATNVLEIDTPNVPATTTTTPGSTGSASHPVGPTAGSRPATGSGSTTTAPSSHPDNPLVGPAADLGQGGASGATPNVAVTAAGVAGAPAATVAASTTGSGSTNWTIVVLGGLALLSAIAVIIVVGRQLNRH